MVWFHLPNIVDISDLTFIHCHSGSSNPDHLVRALVEVLTIFGLLFLQYLDLVTNLILIRKPLGIFLGCVLLYELLLPFLDYLPVSSEWNVQHGISAKY